uniref:Bromo domain-containing protein n=1 Tax=Kalanchoe fedtschenkoi TaxID=63787 RepID=A0A7N0UHD5_KALFE
MALRKCTPSASAPQISIKPLTFVMKSHDKPQIVDTDMRNNSGLDVDLDIREIYFLIMHFLSTGPCHRTYGQLWNELLEHDLLPRRYHAWYSRTGVPSGDEDDNGLSLPLSYNKLVERYPHVEKGHLVSLLKQLFITASPSRTISDGSAPGAADVPTLLGTGVFSLLENRSKGNNNVHRPPIHMRWPHMKADQLRGLRLREIGGGFSRHHRAPSIRAACYAIAKPSTMVQKMQNIKRLRGHRNAVYCAIFDRSGRYVITGSDDRLVKIWSMDTAYCLASCRGHEGDITDLAVSPNNALVASSSNDCIIRVWRLPDGMPVSVLKGHIGVVTAIVFSPRSPYHLLSSSDDGTCRIWDARNSQVPPRIYTPRLPDVTVGRENAPPLITQSHQIFCCAFNANGTVFVTGSSDNSARVWSAFKSNVNEQDQVNHELDVLSGHENDVNYVQFSGCAFASRFTLAESTKEDNIPKFKNSWFTHDNIVTCSRDGSAIIWIPRSRRSHGKVGRWTRAYHLKVPPPPISPQPLRGGPRQRVLPTPRGVNMIVWSLDNRFVLAAIMDCRICVWNAADGSLVHSLTGHSESTYVLDVHPFNPRIAMSAGYDGKTIIWDIWEGIPIRIYEISRFKLVDGKFSPDGTSIILSDDVGQLYILSTGQGESQNDAQYDQFFLGDYRPMIQDTHGNFLDQETQLTPYRRNMLDLLCDSSMIPYPEPYQSLYQRRRLGALNREWQPPTLKLCVGPDITLDRDYQILPLPDLDMVVDPLPEFLDAMDWVPEIEVQSDDNDSEYNVTEDYISGREHVSLSSDSSDDLEYSTYDDDDDADADRSTLKDGSRRSRRKYVNAEAEIMTSSGRRVKRRNFEECGEDIYSSNKTKKTHRNKALKRKFSASNTLRPQRAAASKALTLFSKITGASTDIEDGDETEDELSGSESLVEDSNIEGYLSDDSLQTKHLKQTKGKEIASNGYSPVLKLDEPLETHSIPRNRNKLVLRLSRHPKRMEPSAEEPIKVAQAELVGSSSRAHLDEREGLSTRVQVGSSSHANPTGYEDVNTKECKKRVVFRELSRGTNDQNFRWGGAKARSSKRLRTEEPTVCDRSEWPNSINNGECGIPNVVEGLDTHVEAEFTSVSPQPQAQNHDRNSDELVLLKEKHPDSDIASPNGMVDFRDSIEPSKDSKVVTECANVTSQPHCSNGVDQHDPRLKGVSTPTKLRIRSKNTSTNAIKSPRSGTILDGEFERNERSSYLSHRNQTPSAETFHPDATNHSARCEDNGEWESEAQATDINGSMTGDVFETCPHSGNKIISVFYRRSRSHKAKNNSDADSSKGIESTSNVGNNGSVRTTDVRESIAEGSRRTRSMGLKAARDILKSRVEHVSDEDHKSNARMTNGTRSNRSRRTSNTLNDLTATERRKPTQTLKKVSWLLSSMHDGIRYIPQMGDEVVYLRQGHQQYLSGVRGLRDVGPWNSIKGYIRAVEYCKVVDLEYATFPGSGESCCKLTLEFVDPASGVCGKSFKLTLPEDTGFPDFLVERTRFDAAVQRKWTQRDKCKVWWKNEGDEDGNWWEGRIIRVEPESVDFPDSPWERYTILYKSDPPETSRHSPWELCDHDTQWELPQQPQIEEQCREKLLVAFAKLEESGNKSKDHYGIQKVKQASDKSYFRNRFPVPLSLELIHARLENNYYRSLEALRHDIKIALANAETYFERNIEVAPKIRRLSEWFRRTLSSP